MSWDYFVPDHYFDMQLLMQKQKSEKAKETYLLPLKTFWKPIDIDDPYENDLYNTKYKVKLRKYNLEPPETLLPIALCKQKFSKLEQSWQPKNFVWASNLRPHDYEEPPTNIKFDKFYSQGEMKQVKEITDIKKTIVQKTTKDPYKPNHPF